MARWYPTPLFRDLIAWCRVRLPAAVSAMEQRPDDAVWRDRCLAAMVRAGADVDPEWLFWMAEGNEAHELRRLGPYIVRAAGYPVRGTFAEWVDDVRVAAGVGQPPFVEPDLSASVEVLAPAAPAKIKQSSPVLFGEAA